jgi:beta-barrel assembly-enhancing protease
VSVPDNRPGYPAKSSAPGVLILLLIFLLIWPPSVEALSIGGLLNKAQKAVKVGKAVDKASQDFTPEQEYYIGRAVGANLLSTYPALNDPGLDRYLNLVGRSLAQASDKPETFGGYHFLALKTNQVNAFACPGGLIMVSRGLLKLCRNESDLAAILSHEIGHVQLEHGMKAIKKGRTGEVAGLLAAEAARELTPGGLGKLVGLFDKSIGDVVKKMMTNGYSRDQELEADHAALVIMNRVGYHPLHLQGVLTRMEAGFTKKSKGFAKTHPAPNVRLKAARGYLPQGEPPGPPKARQARFKKALAKVP